MPNTAKGFPYPAGSDAPNGSSQIQALATSIDNYFTGRGVWTYLQQGNTTYNYALTGSLATLPGYSQSVTVASGKTLEVEFSLPQLSMPTNGGNGDVRMILAGTVVDGVFVSSIIPPAGATGFPAAGPIKLSGQATGTGGSITILVQATGNGNAQAGGGSGPWLRYRIW